MEPEETSENSLDESVNKFNTSVSNLNNTVGKLSSLLSSSSNLGGISNDVNLSNIINQGMEASKALSVVQSNTEGVKNKLGELQGQASKFNVSNINQQLEQFGKLSGPTFDKVTKQFHSMMKFIENNSAKFKDILGGASLVVGADLARLALEKFDKATGIMTAEKNLRELQKRAMEINTALEGVKSGSEISFNAFNKNIRESIVLTNSSKEEILGVKKELGEAFSVGVMDDILELPKAFDNFHGALTLTNSALLIGKATGIEYAGIAEFMSNAVLNLSEDAEGAALAIGRIQQSAEKSGIGFNKTMQSIRSSTEALKMWGGTIGAVSPLFDMFSRSLQAGQKGLATGLLEKFTGGLAGMQTNVKALLGLQAGMGGRGGAIGGALEIEAAMEDKSGAGMKKVVDSITKTLTQFGGGRVITRDEAIRDPTAQANFLMQRQLLGKLIGLDEATATKTLDALSGIQQGGLDLTNVSENKFAELIGMGEKQAKEATDPMVTAMNKIHAAQLSGSQRVVDAVGSLGAKLDLSSMMNGVTNTISKFIISGQLNPDDFMRELTRASREKETAKERVNEIKASGREPSQRHMDNLNNAEARENSLKASIKASEAIIEALDKENLTGKEMLEVNTTGKVPDRILKDAFASATEIVNEIGSKIAQDKATPEEVRMFNLMGGTIENLKNILEGGININKADLNIKTDMKDLSKSIEDARPQEKQIIQERPRASINNDFAREVVNNNIRRPSLQVAAAANISSTIKKENISNAQNNVQNVDNKTKSSPKKHEIVIAVRVENDGTIKLKPIIDKIISDNYSFNHNT